MRVLLDDNAFLFDLDRYIRQYYPEYNTVLVANNSGLVSNDTSRHYPVNSGDTGAKYYTSDISNYLTNKEEETLPEGYPFVEEEE